MGPWTIWRGERLHQYRKWLELASLVGQRSHCMLFSKYSGLQADIERTSSWHSGIKKKVRNKTRDHCRASSKHPRFGTPTPSAQHYRGLTLIIQHRLTPLPHSKVDSLTLMCTHSVVSVLTHQWIIRISYYMTGILVKHFALIKTASNVPVYFVDNYYLYHIIIIIIVNII